MLITIITVAVVIIIHAVDNPTWLQSTKKNIFSLVSKDILMKDIRIDGLESLSRIDIERFLPLERSAPWWEANTEVIVAQLKQHPIVGEAKVERCNQASWGCFVVSITERRASFAVSVGESLWAVSDDGAFLREISKESAKTIGLVFVSDNRSERQSPDRLRSVVKMLAPAVAAVERYTKLDPKSISVSRDGELRVSFNEPDLTAVFSSPTHAKVTREAKRLKKILGQLGSEKVLAVKNIDLAYDGMAVISQ